MSDDIDTEAKRIAQQSGVELEAWVKARLTEDRLRERETHNETTKRHLEAKGWKVMMLGEGWSVGMPDRNRDFMSWDKDGSVLRAAQLFVVMLREKANQLEKDLVEP